MKAVNLAGINFWFWMWIVTGILAACALIVGKKDNRSLYSFKKYYLVIGPASAYILYVAFLLGMIIAGHLFPFAKKEIFSIYSIRQGTSPFMIGTLLVLWIGPAEEIFWRGLIQHRLMQRFGNTKGYIYASLAYAGVHIFTLNLMLFLAAMLCAFFWGGIFKKYGSVWPGLISHALWDLGIFVLFPLI